MITPQPGKTLILPLWANALYDFPPFSNFITTLRCGPPRPQAIVRAMWGGEGRRG